MTRVGLASLASLAAVVLAAASAPAQELSPQAIAQIQALLEEKAARTPVQRRVDSQLLAAVRMTRGQPVARGIGRLESVWGRVRRLPGDRALVDIHADVDDTLLARLAGLGVRIESAFPEYRAVRAAVPLRRVEQVAALPGVSFVEPAAEATTNTGSATSQGDAAHRAPDIRALGLTGSGVKVGVLSDGVDSLAARQATGDLPPTCPAGPPCISVLSLQAGSGDEGTAMLEIVHDLAPSAQLYFATAFNGVASFATNIRALRDAGCTVIIDDVTYFNEGAFQDGPIAQAVNDVTATGVLYFSSAANSGNKNDGTSGTWEGDFVNSGTTIPALPESGTIHGFSGVNSDPLTASSSYISLKWSDPLGLSGNDYDLFILDSGLTTVVGSSTNAQNGNDDPYELVAGPWSIGRRIVVVNYLGAAAVRALRVDTNRGRLSLSTAGSTFGHNAGESTISVAATDGRAPGTGNPFTGGAANPVQTYSSDGPRRIFYEPDGTAITPGNVLFGTNGGRLLQKPDITAADCVTTTTPGFIPFCGTSAAAPHAGAIAALLLSSSPAPTPALVRAALGATALDIEAAGIDRDSGRGIVMANRAQAAADLAVTMTGPASVAAGANAVYTLTITHNGIGSAASVVVTNPTPAGLTFVSNTGSCTTAFPCALGTLTAGQTRTITTTFNVPAGYSGANPFTSTATVSSAATDPGSTNNSGAVSTSVTAPPTTADLSVSKTGSASVVRGSNAVYTITVSNAGPDAAASVQVADVTPAGLTFVSSTGDCTTAFPCSLGTLASGATRTITTTFSVPSGYSGPSPFTNTATVSSTATDPAPGNNSSSVSTSMTSQADLSIVKTGPASVIRGANVAYTIVASNAGPSDAGSVQVADATPAGLTFVSNAGDCTTAFPCALGTLASGATRTITATFSVPSGYSGPSPFTNTATITSTTTDPNPANNSSSAPTTVVAGADLSIVKTGPAFATRGADLAYTIVVTNVGPDAAASVAVADPTPAGLTFVSNAGDCASAFPCSLGMLPSGESRTITATFSVPAGYDVDTPIANTASASSATADPDPTNSSDTATSLFGAFYTVTPCRLVDTRLPVWQPALSPGEERSFVLAGPPCGIPVGAAALSVNLTVTGATAHGNLRLYPADVAVPEVSNINFSSGQTRANNAIVPASADGSVAIKVKNSSVGTVRVHPGRQRLLRVGGRAAATRGRGGRGARGLRAPRRSVRPRPSGRRRARSPACTGARRAPGRGSPPPGWRGAPPAGRPAPAARAGRGPTRARRGGGGRAGRRAPRPEQSRLFSPVLRWWGKRASRPARPTAARASATAALTSSGGHRRARGPKATSSSTVSPTTWSSGSAKTIPTLARTARTVSGESETPSIVTRPCTSCRWGASAGSCRCR